MSDLKNMPSAKLEKRSDLGQTITGFILIAMLLTSILFSSLTYYKVRTLQKEVHEVMLMDKAKLNVLDQDIYYNWRALRDAGIPVGKEAAREREKKNQ